MTDSYVIGLTPRNLIEIEFGFNCHTGQPFIRKVTHGFRHIDEATIIGELKNAKDALKEIKDRYDKINFCARTILEGIIDGNDIDPTKLHIYEVNIGKEIC